MAQVEIIRPDSMPALPEFLPESAELEFEFDPSISEPRAGLVEWVEEGVACAVNPAHIFRAYRRRHHCRACGLLVCSACSRSSRPLQGFGLPGDRPQRLCDSCACLSNDDLKTLATLWQTLANKNASVSDLAEAMNDAYTAGFHFARGDALNWERIRQRLMKLLHLEVGVVENLLEELLAAHDLTVERIDELALLRAHRLMNTLDLCTREAPILLPESFRATFNRVLALREHCERRETLTFHQDRMLQIVQVPFSDLAMCDIVEVWGAYQAWAEDNRVAISKALEERVRELLNQVVRRDQSAANAELEVALNSKNVAEVRKAMITCDSVMGILANSPYREHVMPDIHVVIPGFAAHRRSATKLLTSASANKLKVRHEQRRKSLYPPKRI